MPSRPKSHCNGKTAPDAVIPKLLAEWSRRDFSPRSRVYAMNITQHANNWDLSVPPKHPKLTGWSAAGENLLAGAVLLTMALLPVLELICRQVFQTGITPDPAYVQNLALWVGFLG